LPDVIRLLIENSNIGDYQVPEFKGRGGHPVLISAKIKQIIIEQNEININFKDLLSRYTKCMVKVDNPEVLYNINTEPEYEQFRINLKK
jgi:CTP:molybdopterin cytidylyltransferase MocA